MKILEVEQGSHEWHEARLGIITGSRLKDALANTRGKEGFGLVLMYELIAEKLTGQYTETLVTDDMQRGTDLEPVAREAVIEKTGIQFKEYGFCLHDEYDFLGLSPDGLYLSDNERIGLEIKCPSTKKHIETILDNKVPKIYLPQVLDYFLVAGVDKVLFASFDPRLEQKPLHIIEVKREDYKEELETIIDSIVSFHRQMNKSIETILF